MQIVNSKHFFYEWMHLDFQWSEKYLLKPVKWKKQNTQYFFLFYEKAQHAHTWILTHRKFTVIIFWLLPFLVIPTLVIFNVFHAFYWRGSFSSWSAWLLNSFLCLHVIYPRKNDLYSSLIFSWHGYLHHHFKLCCFFLFLQPKNKKPNKPLYDLFNETTAFLLN